MIWKKEKWTHKIYYMKKTWKEKLKDKDYRVNHLYSIKDKNSQRVQFKRTSAQLDFNKNKWTRNIILKSRQLGFTTDEAIDSLDDVLWKKNFDCMMLSYDKNSSEDIFDNKVDFAWRNIPKELRERFRVDTNTKNKLKFDFGDGSFSSISVRSSGRSGTYHRVHISEFAKICLKTPEKANEVITGTLQAVPIDGRVDIESTAEGEAGHFHDMFWEAWNRGEPTLPTEYKAHFYNWTWDKAEISKIPVIKELPQEFRDYQKLYKLTDQEVSYYYAKWISLNRNWNMLKQEYPTTPQEAFEISLDGTYYETQIVQTRNDQRFCKVSYDPLIPVDTFWDLGLDDENVILFVQRFGKELRIIDCLAYNGEALPYYLEKLKEREYKYGEHYVPWDAQVRNMTNKKSCMDIAKEHGFKFTVVKNMDKLDGINIARSIFAYCWFDTTKCSKLISALKLYRKEWDKTHGVWRNRPEHDWTSHYADAFRYLAITAYFVYFQEGKKNEKSKNSKERRSIRKQRIGRIIGK